MTDRPADRVARRLAARYAAERRFRRYGLCAIALALVFLLLLLVSIVARGASAFVQAELALEVSLDAAAIDPDGRRHRDALVAADYGALVKAALQQRFPGVTARNDRRQLNDLVSSGAAIELRDAVLADPALVGSSRRLWLPASDDVDQAIKGRIRAGEGGRLSEKQAGWIAELRGSGELALHLNHRLFTAGDSREPELAGIRGAIVGSLYVMLVTVLISFPLGVATAVYLEEFAPKNRWTDIIEVNINNLAAVPSIVFGLLGLAVFLDIFGLPRSAPLVGGLVLSLITLPTMIIAGRVALKAVPPSIRQAALGIGASPLQTVLHHVLPLAMPGIMTGTIISMARAVGETAPLLMIGMVAFIVDVPGTPMDPATVLPVQVYLWADSPERAFEERASAAIMVLLAFLALMNLAAIVLRRRFERKW